MRAELIEIARAAAEEEGWPWEGPIQVLTRRRWVLFGPVEWEIMTYTDYRGGNVFVTIDDKTGKVISKSFAPY